MKTNEIRTAFLNYFKEKGHTIVDSSSLVPGNDPTLLFTNAGMVQFKDTFLGLEKRDYTRATTSQRCVRAGGKHNDLENVGYTARHHTFFEMLGNFSFGDYFKRDAIKFAWEFLTEVLKLPQEKLWVTVYKDDQEAEDIWFKEMGIDQTRFSRCDEDNFWSMGDTGPCGPCTEIFYDHGEDIPGGPPGSPDEDGDRYIEIWNLVFMQYNRDASGTLHPLPKPSVDTGMGLERIAAVLQDVHSNYEIDLFEHLRGAIKSLITLKDYANASVNVIADHIRSCSFLMADGVVPSNEGRGYVLRRIIRRAVRHGNKLEIESPFFYKLVKPLVEVMGDAYPELKHQQSLIESLLKQEEEQFAITLKHGMKLLEDEIAAMKGDTFSGQVAFKLYDTYGFPADLTNDVLRERSLQLDEAGFDKAMDAQRKRSQGAQKFNVAYLTDIKEASEFVGYDHLESNAKIIALFDDKERCDQIAELGAECKIILDKTPFYPEGGGQVGDRGVITADNLKIEIKDTIKNGDAIIHIGQLQQGILKTGSSVTAKVTTETRVNTMYNHSATHLMHAALRQILGSHVEQKGSVVDPNRLRFDFSHSSALTVEQMQQIERLVNEKIRANYEVQVAVMSPDEAKKQGAMALFGEKYGDKVRVLTMGDFSCELCGGTHVKRTGDIGLFKIVNEEATASGIRRIEAITGSAAVAWCHDAEQSLQAIGEIVKTPVRKMDEMAVKVQQLQLAQKDLEKRLQQAQDKLSQFASLSIVEQAKSFGDVKLLIHVAKEGNPKTLRELFDKLKDKLSPAIIVLIADQGDKIGVVSGVVGTDLKGRGIEAKNIVQKLCGKGGGRPDMAQGGGEKPADFEKQLHALEEELKQKLCVETG